MASKFAPWLAKSLAVLSLGATTLYSSIYTVDEGHRAVVMDRFRGLCDESVGEGTHLLLPHQKYLIFSTRLKPHVFSSICPTNNEDEKIEVCIHAFLKPDEKELPTIFNNFGLHYGQKFLSSIGNEVIHTVIAQFSGQELLTQRGLVSGLIRQSLVQRAAEVNIIIEDVAITGFSYGPELSKANLAAQRRQERLELLAVKPDWLSP